MSDLAWRQAQEEQVLRAHSRRTLLRAVGLGADFSTLNQIPEFASAWGDVQSQVTAEGGSALDVQAAQDTLVKSFSDLTTSSFGLDASQALASAKQYTLAAKTIAGAVTHVQGLINAAQQDPAAAVGVFQLFTGTLIGIAGAAGAFSAGVGALIVSGIGMALSLLQSVGLFGNPPTGQLICSDAYGGNVYCNNADWTIGCNCVWGPKIATGAANWRSFPSIHDTFWFGDRNAAVPIIPGPLTGTGPWGGATFTGTVPGNRAIDQTWSAYSWLELEQNNPTPGLEQFQAGFFSAWKANAEYALNGLQSQPDWQVLLHFVRVWNRSHDPGNVVSLGATPVPPNTKPGARFLPMSGALIGPLRPNPPGAAPPPTPMYESEVMNDVLNNVSADDASNNMAGGLLQIHTGAMLAPKKLVALHFGGISSPASSSASSASSTSPVATAGVVVAGVGIAALAGAAIVSWATGKAIDVVLSQAWKKIVG